MIPAITHQTAASTDLSVEQASLRERLIAQNPGWEHRFYTDADCRDLIRRAFPGLLDVYDAYPLAVQRTDMFRVAALHGAGGVYLDLDVECISPLAPLKRHRCVLAEEETLSAERAAALGHGERLRIANYMFASAPGHPFWLALLDEMVARAGWPIRSDADVLESTGPGLLSTVYGRIGRDYDDIVVLTHPGVACPQCGRQSCQFGGFARHLHRGSWRGQASPATPPARFVVRGHVLGADSLAAINRAVARALEDKHPGEVRFEPAGYMPITSLSGVPVSERPLIETMVDRPAARDDALVSISQHYPVLPARDGGGLSLALVAWEESLVPARMVVAINAGYDAVLATSSFTARSLIDSVVTIPVASIGQPPDLSAFAQIRRADRPANEPFIFLHVSSGFPRKGLGVLLSAWARAFRPTDAVRLVIKTFPNPDSEAAAQLEALRREHPDCAEIEWIDEDIGEEALLDLYRRADAVVSPSRGEGYNLPALEAMAAGIPLVVTGQGGQLDFCGPDTARLIDYRMTLSKSHVATAHSLWAEPNEDDLVAALREMVDPAFADTVAQRVARARSAAVAAADPAAWVDRLEQLVAKLVGRDLAQAPSIAWVGPWRTPCSLAEYSRRLLQRFGPAIRTAMTMVSDRRTPPEPDGGLRTKPAWTIGAPGAWRPIAEAIEDSGADAVVIQHQADLIAWSDLADLLMDARVADRCSLVTLHDAASLSSLAPAELERLAVGLRRASRVLVHTLSDLNRLLDLGLGENATLLPHGVEKPGHTPVIRDLQPDSSNPMIGCAGLFLPGEGVDKVIAACAELRRTWPGLRLRLVNARLPTEVSTDDIRRCLRLAEALGMADAIDWRLEFIPAEDAAKLLGECDLIVMACEAPADASVRGAVRTAVSSLAPVLATPLDVFAELGDAVSWLEVAAPSDMAAAIDVHLRDAPLRRRLQIGAVKWLDAHDWNRVGLYLQSMIEGLVQARRLSL